MTVTGWLPTKKKQNRQNPVIAWWNWFRWLYGIAVLAEGGVGAVLVIIDPGGTEGVVDVVGDEVVCIFVVFIVIKDCLDASRR